MRNFVLSDGDVLTFDPKKKKMIKAGYIVGKCFHRNVRPYHFMQKIQGYGIQENVLEQLVDRGVDFIYIHTETGSTLISTIRDWMASDVRVMDFGNGKQRFLPINRMERTSKYYEKR